MNMSYMTRQDEQRAKNLRMLLEQHWLHCRHIESERAWFMSVYAAITGGMLAYIFTNTNDTKELPLLFLIVLTFAGFILTSRWTYVFEFHREEVNALAVKLDFESSVKPLVKPPMETPKMEILPKSICRLKISERLQNFINENTDKFFKTRYWFPLFYLIILVGLAIYSCKVDDFCCRDKVIAIAASSIAFIFFILYFVALKNMKLGERKLQ